MNPRRLLSASTVLVFASSFAATGVAALGARNTSSAVRAPAVRVAVSDGTSLVIFSGERRPQRISLPGGAGTASVRWFPGGGRVAVLRTDNRTGRSALYTVDVARRRVRRLALPADRIIDLAISPDGRRIAVARGRGCGASRADELAVFLLDERSGRFRRLGVVPRGAEPTRGTGLTIDSLAWSPAGERVSYHLSRFVKGSCRDYIATRLVTRPVGVGSAPVELVDAENVESAWSPTGNAIAFTDRQSDCYDDPCPVVIARPNGADRRVLHRYSGVAQLDLAWSRSGIVVATSDFERPSSRFDLLDQSTRRIKSRMVLRGQWALALTNPHGRYLVARSLDRPAARIVDVANRRSWVVRPAHPRILSEPWSVAFYIS